MKYIIDSLLWLALISATIQPRCVIDEYAIIERRWDWFSPISPPIKALTLARIIMIVGIDFIIKYERMDKGASFCHVDRIRALFHLIDIIADGYHKWHGARPNLIIRDRSSLINIIEFILFIKKEDIDLMISNLDPSAWVKKYFTAASVSWNWLVYRIIGIKARRFSSSPIHSIIQLDLEIAIIVLIIIIRIVDIKNGVLFVIKTWLELNHQIWVRSSYFTRYRFNYFSLVILGFIRG